MLAFSQSAEEAKECSKKRVQYLVRRHIIELIMQSPGSRIRIPSSNVLARKLRVAKSTAQLELERMAAEGLIIPKVGIGTFYNPDCFFGRDSVSIGVIVGDGKCILKSYFTTLMLFGLETEILRHGFQLQEVPVFSNEEDEMVEDLRSLSCRAILWLQPPERYASIVRALAAERPVLVVEETLAGVDSLRINRHAFGYALAREILKKNRVRPVFVTYPLFRDTTFQGIRQAYEEAKVPLEEKQLIWEEDKLKRLRELLGSGFRPDALFCMLEFDLESLAMFREFGVDLESECLFVTNMYKPAAMRELAMKFDFPAEEIGCRAVEILQARLNDRCLPVQNCEIELSTRWKMV